MARAPIGQLLVEAGHIESVQLARALAHQRACGGRLGEALLALRSISESVLLSVIARQLEVPRVEIGDQVVSREIVALLPERLIRARRVFPADLVPGRGRPTLLVATSDPGDLVTLDEVSFAAGIPASPALASQAEIDRAIERHLGARPVASA